MTVCSSVQFRKPEMSQDGWIMTAYTDNVASFVNLGAAFSI